MEPLGDKRGFMPQYYIWFQHGEGYGGNEASSINSNFEVVGNIEEPIHVHTETSYHQKDRVDHNGFHDIVTYAFLEASSTIADEIGNVE